MMPKTSFKLNTEPFYHPSFKVQWILTPLLDLSLNDAVFQPDVELDLSCYPYLVLGCQFQVDTHRKH